MEPLVFAPLFVNGDVKIQKNFRSQHRFEIDPRRGSDAFDHLAALADHDRFLRFTFDDDRRVDLDEVLSVLFFPAIDRHRGRVGQLIDRVSQDLLPDDLRCEESLRLRRVVLDRVTRLPFRQRVEKDIDEMVDAANGVASAAGLESVDTAEASQDEPAREPQASPGSLESGHDHNP